VTNDDYPWEPPLAGTDLEHLLGALNRLRTTFRWKTDDLDSAGLNARLGPSALTLGGLLKHLAVVEDHLTTVRLTGAPLGEPWASMGAAATDDAWQFSSAAKDSPEELYALWDGAVERSTARLAAVIADGGLDQPAHLEWPGRGHLSVRRLVCDVIEEYGRHTGHADLLREAVDGRVGEDPPKGWRAVGARRS
jgi:hypothetical protein